MYDVVSMRKRIDEAVQPVREQVQEEFRNAFRTLYPDDTIPDGFPAGSPSIEVISVTRWADLERIVDSPGLYIILTDYPIHENPCRLGSNDLRAVYRGESYTVGRRVRSHLANDAYRARHKALLKKAEEDGTRFSESLWPNCMKLSVGGPSGINVDQEPYSKYGWMVVVHRMSSSSQAVRKCAEAAFDAVFGRPVASRERARKTRASEAPETE
ncbi:hypothetical protein [Myxococcus faecalis]|uniref:hypothetical protein n=1 Tax=Myxococcus faecalis TaxID=3115646 RepID=UPI003CF3FEA3